MPEASLATSVPAIPMAKPISAFLRAGASLVPSPVMATTWSSFLRPVVMRYLSSGEDLARTQSWSLTSLKFSMFPTVSSGSSSVPSLTIPPTNYLNYLPSMTVQSPSEGSQSSGRIPASLAIAMAVILLSPVTILTLTPPSLHFLTASKMPSRRGSLIPTIPRTTRLFSTSSQSSGMVLTYL